jgi:hypothetical protein
LEQIIADGSLRLMILLLQRILAFEKHHLTQNIYLTAKIVSMTAD